MTEQLPQLDFWEITNLRRVELGKKWKDVLTETELSHETLNRWRKGLKVDPLTDRAFDRALLWEAGAQGEAAAGRAPIALAAPAPAEQASPSMNTRELEVLAGIVASAAEGFDLTPGQLDAAYRRAQELIRERQEARGGDGKAAPEDRAS